MITAATRLTEVRDTVAFLALALLGGIWAVAWGNRRITRPNRLAMTDARTQFQVLLDALRARTAVLSRRDDLSAPARALVDQVVQDHVLIDAVLKRAASADEVNSLLPQLHQCLLHLEQAALTVGLSLPSDQPFKGLCAVDPQHGAATASADGEGLCLKCVHAITTGEERPARLVAKDGRPVPFTEMDVPGTAMTGAGASGPA